jgi:Leucine-rich repeat (LRR) protein
MANNSLSGAIPDSIGRLENLVELGLYNTSLSGLIPSSIGNLTQLNRLYMYYGNLEGANSIKSREIEESICP